MLGKLSNCRAAPKWDNSVKGLGCVLLKLESSFKRTQPRPAALCAFFTTENDRGPLRRSPKIGRHRNCPTLTNTTWSSRKSEGSKKAKAGRHEYPKVTDGIVDGKETRAGEDPHECPEAGSNHNMEVEVGLARGSHQSANSTLTEIAEGQTPRSDELLSFRRRGVPYCEELPARRTRREARRHRVAPRCLPSLSPWL